VDWPGRSGVSIPFDSIRSPARTYAIGMGTSCEVPPRALIPDSVINLVGPEPLFVTKISDDPAVPLSQARQAAAELRVPVNF